ncbi:MAG: phycobiliprotein lyase [Leptolyngbya sp. Prado105]|jgi:hypothetical protein|nr:phycobiliprotein lyase [Leptolyngbya sp. Prado105]
MDIIEFFQESAGKWSSMRTSHYLTSKQQEGGKSTIEIDLLEKSDPAVIQLCELCHEDPATALCGLRVNWDGTLDSNDKKQKGLMVLVPIADPETSNTGKLLQNRGDGEKTAIVGRYEMADNHELTLITESDTIHSQERLWFESPNVRLRHSSVKQLGGFSMASFYSEIRMGNAKPDPQAADATVAKS